MTPRLHWLHEDALNAEHPAVSGLRGADRVCFVWDDEYLNAMDYSFQRLVFIYETLCELPVEIHRGETVGVLLQKAQEMGADILCVPASPNPKIQATIEALRHHLQVEVVDEEPFVEFRRPPSLRRFFAYWKSAKAQLMRP